ncbi:MAG: HD domain-containing protein [Proteobacteria bacterium]|nr:HD domain-containing protein [Pseudomonadota bacterium]
MAEKGKQPDPIVSKSGSDLVLKLYNAIKSLRTVQHDISALHEKLGSLAEKGKALSLQIGRDRLFLNGNRIEMRSGHAVHRILLNELRKRKIGKIEFLKVPAQGNLEEFLRSLLEMIDDGQPDIEKLQELLGGKNIEFVRVEELGPDASDERLGLSDEKRIHARRIYFYALHLLKEMFIGVRRRRKPPNLDRARQVVRTIVSGYQDSPETFIGLATTKTSRGFLANHGVNVAIYAIALGHRLGLSNRFLVDLGLAGLFHDIGESYLPWLSGDKRMSDQKWEEAKCHPALGVKTVMDAVGSIDMMSSRLISGIYEHHLGYDLSGFPKLTKKKSISLVGRIIAIADFYDLAARPYGQNQFPCFSGRLVELIAEKSGANFDPVLVKYFLLLLGIFPVGTLCRLDTGELGIVCSVMEEGTTGDRPWVRLLAPSGETYRGGELVSLESVNGKKGTYRRSITEILDPNELKVDVAEYLMAF